MHQMADIARDAFHNHLDVWSVVVGALVLAWLDQAAQRRRAPVYDAWWYFNADHPYTRAKEPGSKPHATGRDKGSHGKRPAVEPTS